MNYFVTLTSVFISQDDAEEEDCDDDDDDDDDERDKVSDSIPLKCCCLFGFVYRWTLTVTRHVLSVLYL